MTNEDKSEKLRQKNERALDFQKKLSATGLTLPQFAKELGATRNVIYNLSIGQKPSSEDLARRLHEAFERLKKWPTT